MNEMQVYSNTEFGDLEVIIENGKPYFKATQAATILGYSNPKDAILRHCRWVVKHDLPHPQSPNKTISINFISEGDLYRLIVHSRLKSAEKFEKWVFDEVLPSIRKFGMYATEDLLNNPDLLIQMATRLKEETRKRKQAEAKVEIMQPKARYYDEVLDSETLITTTAIAKDFGKSAVWLNKFLEDQEIQYQMKNGQWILKWKYAAEGYAQSKTMTFFDNATGTRKTKQYTCWTEKGRLFIYGVLMLAGYKPNSMRD